MPDHSFSPVAAFYDLLARLVFGQKLKTAQAANLIYIKNNSRILIIGGGSGWILKQVLQVVTKNKVVYLEASRSMLRKAEKLNRTTVAGNQIEFRLGTEESIRAPEKFDFIIANFFLDLFAPHHLKPVIEKLYHALTPNGTLLISDFLRPTGSIKATWWPRILLKSMYLFFRITCRISATSLPNWEIYLRQYSLSEQKSSYFYSGLLKSTVWQKIEVNP